MHNGLCIKGWNNTGWKYIIFETFNCLTFFGIGWKECEAANCWEVKLYWHWNRIEPTPSSCNFDQRKVWSLQWMCSMPSDFAFPAKLSQSWIILSICWYWLQWTGSRINYCWSIFLRRPGKLTLSLSKHILFSKISAADNTRVEEGLELSRSLSNLWNHWFRPRAQPRSCPRYPWLSPGQTLAWCWKLISSQSLSFYKTAACLKTCAENCLWEFKTCVGRK